MKIQDFITLFHHHLQKYDKYLWYFIGGCLAVYIFSWFYIEDLPKPDEILQPLYQQPIQEPTDKEPFVKKVEDKNYMIHPKYEYELYGLIVSHQDLDEKWFNIYYDDDPYNIKDLCVIWGTNLLNGKYDQLSYKSGVWTCYYSIPCGRKIKFSEDELSNNHMLPDTEEISSLLKKARRGDQIHFKGYLVDYSIIGKGGERTTSTNRTDRGNGACEVVYVEDFEILKAQNTFWRFLHSLSFGLMILGLFTKLYIFFVL